MTRANAKEPPRLSRPYSELIFNGSTFQYFYARHVRELTKRVSDVRRVVVVLLGAVSADGASCLYLRTRIYGSDKTETAERPVI